MSCGPNTDSCILIWKINKKPSVMPSPLLFVLSESKEMTITHNTELSKKIIICLSQRTVAHSCQTLANSVISLWANVSRISKEAQKNSFSLKRETSLLTCYDTSVMGWKRQQLSHSSQHRLPREERQRRRDELAHPGEGTKRGSDQKLCYRGRQNVH